MNISSIVGREILDSRGNPTIEVEVGLSDGTEAFAAVPSGASTGKYEALELRDGDPSRFHGKGVRKAIENINSIIEPALINKQADSQAEIDQIMIGLDGSENKSNLGANAILGVSLAVARAAAESLGISLFEHIMRPAGGNAPTAPIPLVNVINGGAHADNSLEFQEFMLAPIGAKNFDEAVRYSSEVFHALRKNLLRDGLSTAVGDEGGFAPNLRANQQALDYLVKAIEDCGYTPGVDVALALDVASTEFFDAERQTYHFENRDIESAELTELYSQWLNSYPIVSIEDGLAEDDWEGWVHMTAQIGNRVQLVGDDIYVTNRVRLERGISESAGNAILVKLNQIGTLSETLEAIQIAKDALFGVVISHRSGETEDTFISDLALATAAGQLKTGSVSRGERTAKYNRILRLCDQHDIPLASWGGG